MLVEWNGARVFIDCILGENHPLFHVRHGRTGTTCNHPGDYIGQVISVIAFERTLGVFIVGVEHSSCHLNSIVNCARGKGQKHKFTSLPKHVHEPLQVLGSLVELRALGLAPLSKMRTVSA